MRSCREVRGSDCQCQCSNSPGFDPQHPPTQWNLRGFRWSSVEYRTMIVVASMSPSPVKRRKKRTVSSISNRSSLLWSFVAGCTGERVCWLYYDVWRISWTPPSWQRYSWRHQGNRGELNQKHILTELNPAYLKRYGEWFIRKAWMVGGGGGGDFIQMIW